MSGTLYALMAGRGKLDSSLKIRIYKTVLRPIITYASAAPTHIRTLEGFQNRTLWMALNAPWFVRNTTIQEDAGVEPLMDFIRRIAIRHEGGRSSKNTTPGSHGGTPVHGHSSWATKTNSRAPSPEPKVD
ncbi:hypothetical protein Trydic_g11036 [Trypoxylus dichotomus]